MPSAWASWRIWGNEAIITRRRERWQMGRKIDMTGGSFALAIIRFAFPLMLMSMLQIFFAACDDMLILGLFVGSQALAAVGATTYIVNLFINGFAGLAVGVNVVVAQAIGAKRDETASKAVHTAIASSLVLGLLLIVVGEGLGRFCLEALDTPADIIDTSTMYLRIYFLSTPANLLFNSACAVMRAEGDSSSPFRYMTVQGILDIVLCSLFALAFDLGVAGVGIGTVLSQYAGAVLSVLHLRRLDDCCHLSLRKLAINRPIFSRILKIGVPSGLNNMAFSFSNMQIQGAVNAFGSAAVAGCSVSTTMENFIYAGTNSIMQACISFTGQNVGAQKLDNVRTIVRWCLIDTCIVGTVLGSLFYFLGYPLLPFFLDDASIPYAMSRNLVAMLPYALCGVQEVFSGVQRGLGKGLAPTVVTLLGICVFRVIWVATAFSAVPTIEMLFMCYPVSWIMTAVAHYICYRKELSAMHMRLATSTK